jgi:hypothetical protein
MLDGPTEVTTGVFACVVGSTAKTSELITQINDRMEAMENLALIL